MIYFKRRIDHFCFRSQIMTSTQRCYGITNGGDKVIYSY
ncbi:unnamed protein product [Brassica oleracea]